MTPQEEANAEGEPAKRARIEIRDEPPPPPPPDEVDALVAAYRLAHQEDSDAEAWDDEDKKPVPFVDWPIFNICVGVVIALNAVAIGAETDARVKNSSVSGFWYLLEVAFCLFFCVELGLRIYFHKLDYFKERQHRTWNIIDTFIVLVSVVDTFILMPAGAGGSARFVAMLRIIRMMRLIRLIRLFKIFKELWLVAAGVMHSIKTLFWVCILIMVFMYICAIPTTVYIGRDDDLWDPYFRESRGWDHEIYFKTMWRSMFSLLQVVTLDGWSDGIARHVAQKMPAFLLFFVGFIAITNFGLLNIIIGIIVESTLATSEKDDEKVKRAREKERQMVFDELRDIFELADEDGSGTLTIDEVEEGINKPEIRNKLKMIEFPVDDPRQLFVLLDYDESGDLSIEEFVTGCIRMKGAAKSKDLLVAQVALNAMRRRCEDFDGELVSFREKLTGLHVTAQALIDHGEHIFLGVREYRVRHPGFTGDVIPRMPSAKIDSAPWDPRGAILPEAVAAKEIHAKVTRDDSTRGAHSARSCMTDLGDGDGDPNDEVITVPGSLSP